MTGLAALMLRTLAWLGRQGSRALAVMVFVAIALPPLDALLKPYVAEAVFVLLCIAFLRIDLAALRSYLRRPGLVLGAAVWTSLAVPLLFGAAALALGLPQRAPDLLLALMLQGITSPMMAAPALAALVGLDATLVLMALIASTALTPFSAPFFAWLFVGKGLSLAPLALGAKLLAMLAGSALVGGLARRLLGVAVIARRKEEIDGFNILVLFIFVAAVMETVAARFLAAPLAVVLLVALAFLVFAALFAATALLFAAAGRERALSLGLMVSQRNLGLMVAATGGALPDLVWLWVALCQFPIYLSPQFLRWWLGRAAPARAAATRSARS